MRILFSVLILATTCFPGKAFAQVRAVVFNADYIFQEGVYLTHESWLANRPDFRWEDIEGEMVQLPEDYRVQVGGMRLSAAPDQILTPYAISLDGFPYLYVRRDSTLDFHEFAGLRFRGPYAYYRYSEKREVTNVMYAYNPLNGRPFRAAPVTRLKLIDNHLLLHVKSGENYPLNQDVVYDLLEDHSDLRRAVAILAPDDKELRQKLLRAIKLFNEREPLLLTISEL